MSSVKKLQEQNQTVNLPITQLKIPPRELIPRVTGGINEDIVSRYADYMRAGQHSQFWPLEVWEKSEEEYWIVSGIHRYRAAVEVGITEIPCVVRSDVTQENFLMEAFVANLGHGYAYEPGERRQVVRTLYRQGYSVKEIHEKTGLPERTLRRWVRDLGEECREERNERIISLAKSGYSQRQIGQQLGVSLGVVKKVLKERRWVTNGHVAVCDPPNNSTDYNRLDCDPKPAGLNICTSFVNPYPDERGLGDFGNHKESPSEENCARPNTRPSNANRDRGESGETGTFQETGKGYELPGLGEREEPEDTGAPADTLTQATAETEDPAGEFAGIRESSSSEEISASEADRPVPNWSRWRDILHPLRQFDMFNQMPKKVQCAVGVLSCLSLTKEVDLDDIANQVTRAVQLRGLDEEWFRNVVNCGLVIHLAKQIEVSELAEKFNLEAEVVEGMSSFASIGCCKVIGPGLLDWVLENLWKEPPDLLLELTGLSSEDFKYALDGKSPAQRRTLKGLDQKLIEFFDSTVMTLRNLRDMLKSNSFKKEALVAYLLCSNKVTTVINEIRHAILRKQERDTRGTNGNSGIAMNKELLEQFRPLVEKLAAMSAKRIPTITQEELENDLWIGAMVGLGTWNPKRSSVETWVKNNIMWRLRQVQRYEYTRLKHEKPYPDEGPEPPEDGDRAKG